MAATDTVRFEDSNLEQAVIKKLAEEGVTVTAENITFADMELLTELEADFEGIISSDGLESATNLTSLNLYNNEITDISPVSELTNLKVLSVCYDQITDISPLSGLTNLEKVYLYDQHVPVENATVSDTNEVFYNVVDIDGNEVPFSLGVIDPSVDEMSGTFRIPTTIGFASAVGDFTGTLSHTIALRGNETATTNEENALSDEQLIEIFEAKNSVDLAVTVDQSAVDYTTPGTYELVLTVTGKVITVTVNEAGSQTTVPEQPTETEKIDSKSNEDSKMSLATTGSIASTTILISLIAIIGLGKLKVINNK